MIKITSVCIKFLNNRGETHREKYPAIIWLYKQGPMRYDFYLYNKAHNENGPALHWDDGVAVYCWHGRMLSKQEINNKNIRDRISLEELD